MFLNVGRPKLNSVDQNNHFESYRCAGDGFGIPPFNYTRPKDQKEEQPLRFFSTSGLLLL